MSLGDMLDVELYSQLAEEICVMSVGDMLLPVSCREYVGWTQNIWDQLGRHVTCRVPLPVTRREYVGWARATCYSQLAAKNMWDEFGRHVTPSELQKIYGMSSGDMLEVVFHSQLAAENMLDELGRHVRCRVLLSVSCREYMGWA